MTKKSMDLEIVEADELLKLIKKAGGQRAFSRIHSIPRSTLQDRLNRDRKDPFQNKSAPTASLETVERGVRRFILSSAQDGTTLHEGFLTALETYRDWLSNEGPCEIMIAGFTYNKSLFEEQRKTKIIFPDRIKPYLRHERIRLGDKVDFCGEMNTLPTAETPLSGFETYTHHRWGIFPHAKVQLKSIPRMKGEEPKMIMTTGAVTKPNYVQKRAGLKASFHHVFGAVLVEIAADGKFFCRHLLGEEDTGAFYDLDRRIDATGVTEGHRVTSISWGDVHVAQVDPVISESCWGIAPTTKRDTGNARIWSGSSRPTMLDALKPHYQFFHDSFDGKARNSHNLKDPHQMFSLFVEGAESMENECREVAMFFTETNRDWCESVVVASNHDGQLERWLKTPDNYAHDPVNAVFFLKCQLAKYQALERRDHNFSIFEHVMREIFTPWKCNDIRFLREDESFIVNGVEQGNHGHLGANGARGSSNTFRKMGMKSTAGHVHGPYITDGAMGSGVCNLEHGYNKGLSNWAIAHTIGLPNGKRQLVTMAPDGEWRL